MVGIPKCCGENTSLYILKGAGLLGALASGCYTTFELMWYPGTMRWAIIFFYLTFFAVVIISAELNLLGHRHFRRFGRFLTTFTGRALFYIFMGGLMLDGTAGWIIGCYMMALGLANIVAQCTLSNAPEAKTGSQATGSPI